MMDVLSWLALVSAWVVLGFAIYKSIRGSKKKVTPPVVERDLIEFDDLPSGVAVMFAWTDSDVEREYHQSLKRQVRETMPVLGRALDRMVEENS